ncbi:hypothetical protein M422DRAFT_35084, partial [Sphaerobolus stellatus SS14]
MSEQGINEMEGTHLRNPHDGTDGRIAKESRIEYQCAYRVILLKTQHQGSEIRSFLGPHLLPLL